MRRDHSLVKGLASALVLLALSACPQGVGSDGSGGGSGATGGGSASGGGAGGGAAGGGSGEVDAGYAISSKGVVRFKRNVRITTDLVVGLGLGFDQVCNELGQYPCTTLVHSLALGGVDPYGSGLYEPLPFTGVTSPIVVDRVAMSACLKRVTTDLAAPASALIFVGIARDSAGKLDPAAPTSTAALTSLYHRLLLRDPTPAELGHLQQLYRDIEAKGRPDPGQDWMTLSCFAIASSVESVFY